MIQLGTSRVRQVDGEELDEENVIIHSTHLTSKAVVLQLGLVLLSYLTMLLGAKKCFRKHALRMVLPNTFGPSSSGLRLCPS
jgi:hypothetical protein